MSHRDDLLAAIARDGGIPLPEAERVFRLYLSHRVIRHNAHDGYSVVHGAFLGRDVIQNAVRSLPPTLET